MSIHFFTVPFLDVDAVNNVCKKTVYLRRYLATCK